VTEPLEEVRTRVGDDPAADVVPGDGGARRRHRHWGRRKRRLRRAAWSLGALAVVGVVAGLWIYRASRPEVWRPGEEVDEITENLSRGLPAEAPRPALADATAEAGLAGFRTFAGARSSQLPEDMGSGAAWGDFDNDGDDDLFLVAAGGPLTGDPAEWAPSKLYENRGEGTFREVVDFPELRIVGMAAAWGDADGDGWLDLVVTGYRTLALFRNEAGRLVRDESAFAGVPGASEGFWAGAAWGDFDNDRDLDLYVTGYVRYVEDPNARAQVSQQYGHAVPYTLNPVSYDPERNLLLRNRGDGSFDEVAEALGVSNPEGRSLGALWHDFDDDGRLDLYVANDVSDNALYLNRADGFEDAGLAAWVADYRGAMGLAAGDYDRDGDDDLFVTHWIAQENALYDSLLADVRERDAAAGASPGGPPAGPALPAGIGFSDMAAPLGLGQIALRFVGWGTEFVDLDADGWLDLVVANGSTFERKDDHTQLDPQVPLLLWNQVGEHFHDLAPANELLAVPHVGRGLAVSDYDGDGDPDLAIVQHGEGVQLLRNDMAAGRSISLKLVSRTAAGELRGFGDGAKVVTTVGDAILRRTVGGASYLSQSSRILHFGLGEAERVDELEVRWLGGGTDVYRGLEAGALWELREGEATTRRMGGAAAARPAVDPKVPTDPRERTLAFWQAHRAGMDAIKTEGDPVAAEPFFRRALALDPKHEDARYYLAASLAAQGETAEALEHLRELARQNPQSHRAFKRWGTLETLVATKPAELAEAARALERALQLNQEETGSLLVLGEVALLQGDPATAERRLEWACATNPKAVGGFFLRGYVAWTRGDDRAAAALLHQAREALGPEWKPEGMVSEGDTTKKMHEDATPLASYWQTWDGQADPATAYAALDDHLRRFRG
jgi:Tfp pilus assembly protein PilF